MDPLSVAASAIALAGLTQKLLSGLGLLIDLSYVPNEIATLIDELYDFRTVLTAVCIASNQRSSKGIQDDFSEGLRPLLAKGGRLLSSIAVSCGIDVQQHHNPIPLEITLQREGRLEESSIDLLSRFRWLRDKKKIDRSMKRLNAIRMDISNYLASVSLMETSSVLSEVRDLAVAFQRLHSDHSTLHHAIQSLDSSRRNFEDSGSISEISAAEINPGTDDISRSSASSGCRIPDIARPDPSLAGVMARSSAMSASRSKGLLSNVSGILSCLSSCSCSCHKIFTTRTPAVLNSALGSCTVKFNGLSGITPSCNEVACLKSNMSYVKVAYRFPPWLLKRMVNSVIYSSRVSGPHMSLSSARVIQSDSDIFFHALAGNMQGIQDLFRRGLASPFDASQNYGYTALHYAIDYGHLALCEFLLKAGTKADLIGLDGNTPTDIAYHKICSPSTDDVTKNGLRDLFEDDAWLEGKQFTLIHKIVLDLLRPAHSLEDDLKVSTKDLDKPDSTGRTPLSWAAERGDNHALAILLKYGASTNNVDCDSNSPLHLACKAPTPLALSTLLSAGAKPTTRNKWYQGPLNYAAFYQNDYRYAEQLLQHHGVDIDEVDQYNVTAIANATFRGHDRMVEWLLNEGADVNLPDADSTTPILQCINRHQYRSLHILLRKAKQCELNIAYKDHAGETCLHYLARRADCQTSQIFLDAVQESLVDCAGLDTGHLGKDGLNPRDVMKLRGDVGVAEILEKVMILVDLETAAEWRSLCSDDSLYQDTFELLPQVEKDIGLREPLARIREIL